MDIAQKLQEEINELRKQLKEKESLLAKINSQKEVIDNNKLTKEEISRFSRQIILPEVGVKGQLKFKNSSVLIVGAGGLGCPAALYLVGAGIGTLGLVDYDLVEINNLHRQLLHTETSIGTSKCDSAKNSLLKLNSSSNINIHNCQLNRHNALHIIGQYDIVLDATDNVATRYLLNDACIMLKKPLVSGSALQLEGQLTVYGYLNGPCYRCIFPIPPPPEAVTNCGDGGVIGAVPGVIGTLQAMEVLKILLELEGVLTGRLLLFDGSRAAFRTVRLRGKRENCDVCSDKPIITRLIDYEQFCGMRASDKDFRLNLLEDHERVSVYELNEIIYGLLEAAGDGSSGRSSSTEVASNSGGGSSSNDDRDDKELTIKTPLNNFMLIDVRSANEFEICNIPRSINIPIKDILDNKLDGSTVERLSQETLPIFVVCRRGNDSQLAVKRLQGLCVSSTPKDIIGGLHSWARCIDSSFPIY